MNTSVIPGAKTQPKPKPKLCILPPDILEKVGVNMILDRGHVFYANMLLQMDKAEVEMSRDTLGAAVYVQAGRVKLIYDRGIWEEHGLKMDDIIYILKHEIGHVMLEHFSRRKGRNPEGWNVAADFAVNCILGKTNLPLLWPSKAPWNFPEDLAAEEYWKLLPKKEIEIVGGTVKVGGQDGGKGSKHQADQEVQDDSDAELNREVVRQAVEKAYNSCKNKGNLPGKLEQLIEKLIKNNRVDWRRQLRQIVGTAAKAYSRLTWKKASKRYGEDSKGTMRRRALNVVAVIDSSGSVPDKVVNAFFNEIIGIQKAYRGCTVHYIECDCQIQRYVKLTGGTRPDFKVRGRGGTSFKPPFTYLAEKKIRPDVLVYLTDLYGDFPEEKPAFPVCWVACDSGDNTAPFGWTVPLKTEDIDE